MPVLLNPSKQNPEANMHGTHTNSYDAAPSAARTRVRAAAYACACPWQHGMRVVGVNVTSGVCPSIAFDVLRTEKGGYGSSG